MWPFVEFCLIFEAYVTPRYTPLPLNQSAIKEQVEKRQFEKHMSKIFWGIVAQACLLFLVNCIGWGIMNESFVLLNQHAVSLLDWDPKQYDQEVTGQVKLVKSFIVDNRHAEILVKNL